MQLSKKLLIDAIDYIILSVLGFLFLGYSMFYKSFAEIHIQLPFLDFPIFIGEIFLVFCVVLTLYKWFLSNKKFNKIYIAFLFYVIFVLGKAFVGYREFGPLAFRHAAMFYYPLFGLIAYETYHSKFKNPHLLLILFFILNLVGIAAYYRFTYVILMFIYVILLRSKILKFAGLLAIALSHSDGMSIFIKLFSHCPRTQIIGNIAAFLFLFMAILLILKVKKVYKISLVVLFLFILGVGLIKISHYRSGYKFLIKPKSMLTSLKEWEEIIKIRRKDYQKKEIPVKLYNPEENKNVLKTLQIIKEPKGKQKVLDDDISIMKVVLPPKDGGLKEIIVNYIENKGGSVEFSQFQQLAQEPQVETTPETISQDFKIVDSQDRKRLQDITVAPQETVVVSTAQPKPKTKAKKSGTVINSKMIKNQNVTNVLQENKESPGVRAQKAIDALQKITQDNSSEITISFDIEKSPEPKEEIVASLPIDDNLKKQIIYHITDLAIQKNEYVQSLSHHWSTGAYRLLTWRDMIKELIKEKALIGFHFGKPLRSESIEISRMAYGEWTRDGWITAHNSYMEWIYRSGIIGIILILCFFISLFRIIKSLIKSKSLIGILLFSIIICWVTVALVYVTFEMPYSAIFFWSLFGFILAYSQQLKGATNNK